MNTTTAAAPTPEALRQRMVEHVISAASHRSTRVLDAMRTVPRHAFVPAASPEEAYANQAVITKRAVDGAALSCASVPTVVATMLDQLDVRPGDNVLEIGAGTGYNAALLAHLAGPSGQVTTIDIDDEVTGQARQALDATGYGDVRVIARDGLLGAAEHAPYDRVVVTVGAWDLPAAWWDQLVPGGRLVVPLRWRGQTRSVAFVHDVDRLRSDSVELCGFVPMVGQGGEHTGHIAPDGLVSLYWDAGQAIDASALYGVLDTPRTAVWSGVTVGPTEPFDGVWLRMTGTEPGTCRISAEPAAVKSSLCTPGIPSRSPALAEGNSLAYFLYRRLEDSGAERQSELGAIGHGPAGPELADRLCEQIRAWGRQRTTRPVVTAYPADTPDQRLAGSIAIDKPGVRLTLSW